MSTTAEPRGMEKSVEKAFTLLVSSGSRRPTVQPSEFEIACRAPWLLRMVRSTLHRLPPPESERAGRLRSSGGLIFRFYLTLSELLDCFFQGGMLGNAHCMHMT
jgi:hypothetical protein